MRQMIKKRMDLIHTALLSALCALPSASHAASIESIVMAATRYLTGSVAKSIGVLVVIGLGYLTLFTNKFPKESFIMVLVGSGMIFGGAELYRRFV